MKNISKYLILSLASVAVLSSCETLELDITENPNALTPTQANPDFFLNSIQEDFVRHLEGTSATEDNFTQNGANDGFNEFGMELTRTANFNVRNYQSAFQGTVFDDEWINAYRGILADIRAMQPLAEEAGLTRHIGIAQFVEAYVFTSLVDFFGDIPYTEAIQEGNNSPALDSGASIYDAALNLLDQAIVNFTNTTSADPPNDFFYNNDYDKWVLAANTLKMKLYLQRRLVDANAAASFNAIVNSGNYIQDTADDFQYSWPATSATNPDNRHPRYGINYAAAGAGEYMSNWMMWVMDNAGDPRLRYYVYRQTDAVPGAEIPPNEELLNCSLETPPQHYVDAGFGDTFCYLENGFWGRAHGEADGIPPDGLLRATWGVYPAAGRFDDDTFTAIAQGATSAGGNGAGISPILTAFMVDFWRAEFAMEAGDAAAAETFISDGLTKQIAKVQPFAALDVNADLSFEPSAGDITSFINSVTSAFNSADTNGKWDILGEQYLISTFGNGIEPYNFYRRTNFPTTLQPNLEPDPGTFINSMFYPQNEVNGNANLSQKATNADTVFWDTNGTPPAN
ncbi:SusD/RagB family nutrient-binding outer membrane lipoprotein [Flagellimonas sp. 2504JD4-2]